MSAISRPPSSPTSRATVSSSDSPGSTKPARTLYHRPAKRRPRASRISSPRVTRTRKAAGPPRPAGVGPRLRREAELRETGEAGDPGPLPALGDEELPAPDAEPE